MGSLGGVRSAFRDTCTAPELLQVVLRVPVRALSVRSEAGDVAGKEERAVSGSEARRCKDRPLYVLKKSKDREKRANFMKLPSGTEPTFRKSKEAIRRAGTHLLPLFGFPSLNIFSPYLGFVSRNSESKVAGCAVVQLKSVYSNIKSYTILSILLLY